MEKISDQQIIKNKSPTHKFFKIFDRDNKKFLNLPDLMNVVDEIYCINYCFVEKIEKINEKILKFFFFFLIL